MMPFWLFVLGRFYFDFNKIKIPYANIAAGLVTIIVPCGIGILIRQYKPRAADAICKAVKPLSYAFIIFLVVFGSLSNIFIYILMGRHWYIIPTALLLPYLGFLLGYVISFILRQPKNRAITISIETGIQDTSIAIVLLQSSFQMPDGDLASSIAMASALFTPFPLIILRLWLTVYNLCWLKGKCTGCGGPTGVDITETEATSKQMEAIENNGFVEKFNLKTFPEVEKSHVGALP